VAAFQAQRKQEAEQARITAERQIKEAEVERDRAVKARQIDADRNVEVAQVEQKRTIEIAQQDKAILIAKKSEEQSQAEARANAARADAVKAEQGVVTAQQVAEAERGKQVALVEAEREAQRQAISVKVAAEAEKDAAENHAAAIRIRAEANQTNYEVEAAGKRLLNEATNTLSAEQIAMQVRLKLIEQLPRIIAESVKPMEKIDGIKIVQVDGMARQSGGAAAAGGAVNGNLADQAVNAALAYRAQAPLVDALMRELGLDGSSLAGLARGTALPADVKAAVAAAQETPAA